MTFYRSIISKTLETYLEFDESELNGLDPDEFAWQMSRELPTHDWIIANTEVETEEFPGDLPELG